MGARRDTVQIDMSDAAFVEMVKGRFPPYADETPGKTIAELSAIWKVPETTARRMAEQLAKPTEQHPKPQLVRRECRSRHGNKVVKYAANTHE